MLERDALNHVDVQVGDVLEFQLQDGSTDHAVVGVCRIPPWAQEILASPYAYVA